MIIVRHASDARAQREEDSISDDEAASVIISAETRDATDDGQRRPSVFTRRT
jgi:hypothetical protein